MSISTKNNYLLVLFITTYAADLVSTAINLYNTESMDLDSKEGK